jgi:hypothetical protein
MAAMVMKDFQYKWPRGNGAVRWEVPLGTVGLAAPPDRPIPPAMDRALAEMCVLRDGLSHQGGRVHQRAVDAWPGGGLQLGSFVRISQTQVRRYSAAVGIYGSEIRGRLLARFDTHQVLDLSQWEQHGFIIERRLGTRGCVSIQLHRKSAEQMARSTADSTV